MSRFLTVATQLSFWNVNRPFSKIFKIDSYLPVYSSEMLAHPELGMIDLVRSDSRLHRRPRSFSGRPIEFQKWYHKKRFRKNAHLFNVWYKLSFSHLIKHPNIYLKMPFSTNIKITPLGKACTSCKFSASWTWNQYETHTCKLRYGQWKLYVSSADREKRDKSATQRFYDNFQTTRRWRHISTWVCDKKTQVVGGSKAPGESDAPAWAPKSTCPRYYSAFAHQTMRVLVKAQLDVW